MTFHRPTCTCPPTTPTERVARTILRNLAQWEHPRHHDWTTRADLNRAVNSRDRKYIEDALGLLLVAGRIEYDPDRGYRWRRTTTGEATR